MIHSIISREQIQKIAGKDRFQQGVEDFQSAVICHFQFDDNQAQATVNGFHVRIQYQASNNIEAACDCSDSEGFDFCRHGVCLVLHTNKMAQQLLSLSKGPDKSKILAYLLTMDKQSLARQCLELIEQDSEQIERFLLRVSLRSENIDFAELKRQVTQLTRNPDKLFSQRQVKHFFSRIDRFLEELLLSNYLDKPERMIKVIEYLFQRINLLLGKLDDASGQRSDCIEKLRDLYRSLFLTLVGRPDTKAKRLHALWITDRYQLLGPDIAGCLQGSERQILEQKFIDLANASWQSTEPELQAWQREKLARYLMEAAIARRDTAQEQEFRRYLTKN